MLLFLAFFNDIMRKNEQKGHIMETLRRELEEIEKRRLEILYELYIIEKYEMD